MDEIVKKEETQLDTFKQKLDTTTNFMVSMFQSLSTILQGELTNEQTAQLHDFTTKGKESFEAFKENSRERLLDILVKQGKQVTERGTLEIMVSEGRKQRAIPTNAGPDSKNIESLFRSKGLSPDSWMRRDVKYKVDDMLLKKAVDAKLITEAEVKACYPPLKYRIGKTVAADEEDNDE